MVATKAADGHLTTAQANRLAVDNLPLVDYVVADVAARLPRHISRDEMRSAALLALVQTARSYDPQRGIPFAQFARPRLRGAILDELRGYDWMGRTVRLKVRQRAAAEDVLSAQLGRLPTTGEVAEHLGVPMSSLSAVEADVHRSFVLSLQRYADAGTLEAMLPADEPGPEDLVLRQERVTYLLASVRALPGRLRRVIEDYYLLERPMVETAAALRVTESRVSQMRAEALALLKEGLTAMLFPERAPSVPSPVRRVARRRGAYHAAMAARLPRRMSA